MPHILLIDSVKWLFKQFFLVDCDYNGKVYKSGEKFRRGDGCDECECLPSGKAHCSNRPCYPGGLLHNLDFFFSNL